MREKIEQTLVATVVIAVIYLAIFSDVAEKSPSVMTVIIFAWILLYGAYRLRVRQKNEKRF